MIMDVFDSNFVRIGNFSKTIFVQYVLKFTDAGTFDVTVPFDNNVLSVYNDMCYILLDEGVLGEIETVQKTMQTSSRVEIKGSLIDNLLSSRVFMKTQYYTGSITDIAYMFVDKNFVTPENIKRKIPIVTLSNNALHHPTTKTISTQRTGNTILAELQDLLEPYALGFTLYPIMQDYDELNETDANISALEFRVLKGTDRSMYNTEGNEIVCFSESLSNLISFVYKKDASNYKNCAIVAGEGTGQLREVQTVTNEQVVLPATSNVVCLMHFDDMTDSANAGATISFGSDASVSNVKSMFGGRSANFKGLAQNAGITINTANIPSGDFTLEFWEYRNTLAVGQGIYASHSATNQNGAIISWLSADGFLYARAGSADDSNFNVIPQVVCGNTILNQWVHRAFVRQGTTIRIYENGILYKTLLNVSTLAPHSQTNKMIGSFPFGASLNGYIDEFRISNVARYAGNSFTLQECPFNIASTTAFIEKSGIERKEVYIDAKDIQSTTSDGTVLTRAQYLENLIERGYADITEYRLAESISAEVLAKSSAFEYGKDFFLGDMVSFIDTSLNMEVQAVVSEITVTSNKNKMHYDAVFGYKKISSLNKLKRKGVV